MTGLLFLLLVIAIICIIVKGNQGAAKPRNTDDLTAQWIRFIAGYDSRAKTKGEKRLVQSMLQDLKTQGFVISEGIVLDEHGIPADELPPKETAALEARSAASVPENVRRSPSKQLDNVSILLYLGAFLFIASVGLFVAFGGYSGTVRTVAVALVALVLYAGGVWLYRKWQRLAQAGLAFVGIGMATVPFVGLAAYSFMFHASSGALVWMLTSLACLVLYAHALLALKRPLLNYILIFTILSLVESSVSVVNAPIYYFGWGLGWLGILLAVLSRFKGLDGLFQESANTSAKFFVPLASVVSLLLVGRDGTGQLGVSLLLTAAYYAFECIYGAKAERPTNAAVAQISTIIAAGMIAYGFRPELWTAAATIMVVCAVQAVVVAVWSKRSEMAMNFATIMLGANVVALFLACQKSGLLVIGLVLLITSSIVVWLRQARADAYCVAAIAWMMLPLVFGQLYLAPRLHIDQQAYLLLGALLVQLGLLLGLNRYENGEWRQAAKMLYVLSAVSVLVMAMLIMPLACMIVSIVIAASLVLLCEFVHESEWAILAGFAATVPLMKLGYSSAWFASGTLVALAANLVLALRYRLEVTRWLVSALWLLLPLALGTGFTGQWTPAEFGWAYTGVFLGFVAARMVARGEVLLSFKTPVASLERNASASYVVGYIVAALVAVLASILSASSQLHTSAILVVVGLMVWLLAAKVERQPVLFATLPLFAQALLLSAFRPDATTTQLDWYLVSSIGLALYGYVAPVLMRKDTEPSLAIRQGSLLTGLVAPSAFAFAGETHLLMPIGVLAFAGMLYHYAYKQGQQTREAIGGLGLLGIWWLMWFFGVRNVQAFTHVLAALFALYAYWRYARNERATSDQYVLVMLATATIPLVIQALMGTAGSVYGWWLLLEQIFFLLLGMAIRRRFVVWWGLFVAVGSVIYQLRHLGWAALTVLALFLIGIAMYLLQKQNKNNYT